MGNAGIIEVLNNWIAADKAVREAVEAEIEARAALVALAFPNPTEGTNNAPLPDGNVLRGKFPNTYKLSDIDAVQMVEKSLPPALRSTVFKWKPEISVSAYKALEPAHKRLVNEVLTIKPGRPQLEIMTPKVR